MGLFDVFKKKETSYKQDNTPKEHEVIIESDSLLCDVKAFVERYNNCYYFYLWFNPMSPDCKVKACWICNRSKAPEKINTDDMGNGKAPMMPAEFVDHELNGISINEKALSIVWFEEGASAALLCDDEILCVIPEWSGFKDFHGYAKYAKGTGPFAWEITGALERLTERINNAKKFWETFAKDEKSAWMWLSNQLSEVKGFVGNHEDDFNIANKTDKLLKNTAFPPKIVTSGTRNGIVYGITAGVSLAAMPSVDMYVKDEPKNARRIELGFAAEEKFRQICRPMYANISMYASIPWQQLTFLAHGHTVPFNNIKGFEAVLFVNPHFVEGLESPAYSDFLDGGTTNMLWVVPITKKEYDFIVNNDMETLMQKAADPLRIHIFDGKNKFLL
ncbi:MAG: suppressor of fused domain protein [Clostridium sp.]|nr:suppressor of fused domain protein [Clostridium sp.]MCM1547888.1 suppressor of fused domain protein [Ruminococcus sp.]